MPKPTLDKLLRVIDLLEALIQSADNAGCSEDLTVVSKSALDTVEDFIVNHCSEEDIKEDNRA